MKTKNLVFIMAGFLSWLTSCKARTDEANFQDDKFKIGQIWSYKTREGEEDSKLTILKVEKYDSSDIVIHIYVNGLKIKNAQRPSGYSDDIGHLPLSKEALLNSVTTLVSENNKLPNFKEDYTYWKEAFDNNEGGVFSVTVKDAVKYVEETMRLK